jgi:transcriptional regulator GlxA family with amidase domain
MVERSGLNERTFKRRFRAATGHSPMDYVQTLRIEEAKQTLETSDTATDEIAYSLGYDDPTYFRRLFKKRTGITPGRYRQRYRSVTQIRDTV